MWRLAAIENDIKYLRDTLAIEGICQCPDNYNHLGSCSEWDNTRQFHWGRGERSNDNTGACEKDKIP